jgi:AbiV family abortive infection protein
MATERGVAPDVLLLGALYALEQSYLLLTDAIALLEQRRYPTSAAIALLAHEEVGRHKILLDLWRRSAAGMLVTRAAVKEACDDHVEKQRRGGLSLLYRMQEGDQVHKLVLARQRLAPGSDERRAADNQLALIDQRRIRRQPTARHEKRMSASYVDLVDGDNWSRPCDLDAQGCADDVVSAMNDYTAARLRVEETATIHGDDQLAKAAASLADRPALPPIPPPSIEAIMPSSFMKE